MAIRTFTGRHAFLSNFHPSTIRYEGADYPTAEHAFQAQKTTDPGERERVRTAPTPAAAKARGRKVTLRPDWEQTKDGIMLQIQRAKYWQSAELADALRATGDEELQEGNIWNDTYWGISLRTGKGRNRLGEILQRVREEARDW